MKKAETKLNIVLVGTYRPENESWIRERRLYNLPLPFFVSRKERKGRKAGGARRSCTAAADGHLAFHEKISGIVLFAEGHPNFAFKAKFKEVVDGSWLKTNGYSLSAKPHGEMYALYELCGESTPAKLLGRKSAEVFVSSSRCPVVKIDESFYSKPYPVTGGKSMPYVFDCLKPYFKKWKSATTFNPVQGEFFNIIMPESAMQYAKPRKGSYRIVSLFAGCGGLDLGFIGGFDFLGDTFQRNKFDVVWANELNPSACKTYERNLGAHIVCGDIKDHIKSIPSDVDVVMGGFPCQDISINGKMQGIKGKRSSLYSYIVEAVKKCRPKVFLAENVGSLMLKQHEQSFKKILSDFEALDYNVTYKVYHAEQYGVPQTRERIIFVGTRKDIPAFRPPDPIPGKPITCGAALRDLEDKPADRAFSHIWSAAAPSGEQGSRKMVEDRPGYTIRAECHGNIQFHYKLPRRLSMREAARIQSFPDSYVFPCGIRETERQIGNAVPPVLAWHIARKVQKVLELAR